MPYIKVIDQENAEGKLKEVYKKIISARGKLSNIMSIHSLNPDSMIKHMELYKTLMFSKSNLSRVLKEMVAVVVSKANKCNYCLNHHAEAVNFYWKDEKKLNRFIEDFRSIDVGENISALLEYAYKLTVEPHNVTQADVDVLKSKSWSDEDILLTNMIVSYFNFVNRIALGLGVEFSEEEVKGYKY